MSLTEHRESQHQDAGKDPTPKLAPFSMWHDRWLDPRWQGGGFLVFGAAVLITAAVWSDLRDQPMVWVAGVLSSVVGGVLIGLRRRILLHRARRYEDSREPGWQNREGIEQETPVTGLRTLPVVQGLKSRNSRKRAGWILLVCAALVTLTARILGSLDVLVIPFWIFLVVSFALLGGSIYCLTTAKEHRNQAASAGQ
ncbi:hypothetical protein GIS00_20940 [Nakamurella sp. YIM 132087]|uniref:Uncharacterized protein n=1 Tax=Nakamurella alba TaxID=2665158 RepID=A0A7K1FQI6_9ACTN|nr:hypothetical protein [Nakamurella alba]MTD16406.1 hypothetical protein [Nakamurella alba]